MGSTVIEILLLIGFAIFGFRVFNSSRKGQHDFYLLQKLKLDKEEFSKRKVVLRNKHLKNVFIGILLFLIFALLLVFIKLNYLDN